jgi:hypothetical protein
MSTSSAEDDVEGLEIPTGDGWRTAERIAEVKAGKSDPFPYYWEEYGLVDGQHLA